MYVCTRLLAFFSDCRPSWSSLCFSPPPQTTLVLPTITWHRQQKQHSTARGNHLYTGSSMIAGGVSRPRSGALVCRYKLYVFHTIESYVYNVSGTYQKYMTTASSVDYQLCDKKKGQQTTKPNTKRPLAQEETRNIHQATTMYGIGRVWPFCTKNETKKGVLYMGSRVQMVTSGQMVVRLYLPARAKFFRCPHRF